MESPIQQEQALLNWRFSFTHSASIIKGIKTELNLNNNKSSSENNRYKLVKESDTESLRLRRL